MFLYPSLQCVYKFDYYIDPEELYDHNHDENRINNDAYQHLFLGTSKFTRKAKNKKITNEIDQKHDFFF